MQNIQKVTNYSLQFTGHPASGFSLIELLVSIFFLGIITVTIVGLTSLGTRLSIESERQTVAQAVVNDHIEYVRSLPYRNVGYTDATGSEPDGVLLRQEEATRNQQKYQLTTTVVLIDDTTIDSISLPPGGLEEPNEDYKQVTVAATWQTAGGNERNVSVVTYVADGGNFDSCTPGLVSCPDGSLCPATGVCPNTPPLPNCPEGAYFCMGAGAGDDPAYLTTATHLFSFDSTALSAQVIGPYGDLGTSYMTDLASDSNGQLFGISDSLTDANASTTLHLVDSSTGSITPLAPAIDTAPNQLFTGATFLTDGRLAVGGNGIMKFVEFTNNGAINSVSQVNLVSSGLPVAVSGDMVQRNGTYGPSTLWFIGRLGGSLGLPYDYCFEADPSTGQATILSGLPLGNIGSVTGAVCTDEDCNEVRVFMKGGTTKLINPENCASSEGINLWYPWEGAT